MSLVFLAKVSSQRNERPPYSQCVSVVMSVSFCEAETVLCVCERCKALTVQSEHSGRGRGGDDSFSADKLWVCSASEAAASTY